MKTVIVVTSITKMIARRKIRRRTVIEVDQTSLAERSNAITRSLDSPLPKLRWLLAPRICLMHYLDPRCKRLRRKPREWSLI